MPLRELCELQLALQSGGSAVQDIIDKTVRIENQAADVQKDLDNVMARIKSEKAQKNALEGTMAKTNATVAQLQGEVVTQEGVLAKAEQDRADKDDQIRTLKDEISHQGEMITKLGKDKRAVGDSRQKTEEDIQAAVSDLERVKGELQAAAARKDKEGSALSAKIDDEATLGSKYAKQAKELQARLEELDEELAVERGNRSNAEKSRTMLKKDIEDIASRLEEAGSNTSTQVELNKKRE